jgi:hypothetical protein
LYRAGDARLPRRLERDAVEQRAHDRLYSNPRSRRARARYRPPVSRRGVRAGRRKRREQDRQVDERCRDHREHGAYV